MATIAKKILHLLECYFELSESEALTISQQLRPKFPEIWIYQATIESIYQGRYRWVSIVQILSFWQRRGQPNCHFSCDYERLLLGEISDPKLEILNHSISDENPEAIAPISSASLVSVWNTPDWEPIKGEICAFVPQQDRSGISERLYDTLIGASDRQS